MEGGREWSGRGVGGRRTSEPNRDRKDTGARRGPRSGPRARGSRRPRACRPANVGEHGRESVDQLMEPEASLASEMDTPGQARKIGSSEGSKGMASVAKRNSGAGGIDKGDEGRKNGLWVSTVKKGGKVIPGCGWKPMEEEVILDDGKKAGEDRARQPGPAEARSGRRRIDQNG